MKPSKHALIIATLDTKGHEAAFMKSSLTRMGVPVMVMDAGILGSPSVAADMERKQVAAAAGKTLDEVRNTGHEGMALNAMIEGAVRIAEDLYRDGKIGGILSLGGSMGTTLGTAVMRKFPVGFPKVMVTTMASRDTRAFVGTADVMMLHAVCDLVGLNRITRKVLHNGAMAVAGMMMGEGQAVPRESPLVFVSTLGTTENCAQLIRKKLDESGNEVVVFHTVGSGGRAMEEMIYQENVTAVVDLSLHEMADHRFGGDYDAGPARGSAALQKGIPLVMVPGNVDFLVTGPLQAAKARFPGRPLHQHNAAITVVKTSAGEMASLARTIADSCNEAAGPWRILVPMGGFSAFDNPQGPLFDPEGRKCFLEALRTALNDTAMLRVMHCHVNEPEFAAAILESLGQVMALE